MTLTPEQFNKIALKEDLVELASNMATKEDLHVLKDEILTAIDGLAKNVKDMKSEQSSNIAAHDRPARNATHSVAGGFETRITNIEKHLDLKPAFDSLNN